MDGTLLTSLAKYMVDPWCNVCIHRSMITNPNIDNITSIAWKVEGHDICRLSNTPMKMVTW
jgi:hypothetical protein